MSNVIEYNLPKVTADQAAAKAIAVLKDVEKLGGDSLYYCIQASNVLALAGLRTLSPYNEFHTDFSEKKLKELNKVLQKYDCRVLKQDEYGTPPEGRDFSIMNVTALHETPKRYPMTADAPLQSPPDPSWTTYTQWTVRMWIHYANLISEGKLPKKWVQSWYIPHDIHFGMMLGYPGVALEDGCERGIDELDSDNDMDMVSINIDTLGMYDGTHVCYRIAKKNMKNQQIIEHSEQMKETLEKVYEVYSDSKLMSVPGFKEESSKFKV